MGNSDSKLAFSEGLSTFVESSESDTASIQTLFSSYISLEDVYEIMTPDFIRVLRREKPSKLLGILDASVAGIYDMYEKSIEAALSSESDKMVVQNSVRVLTRIIPFVNDDSHVDEFICLLWNSKQIPRTIDEANPECLGFKVIGALMRSAFIRGFSLPSGNVAPSTSVDPNRLEGSTCWGRLGGIGGLPSSRSTYSVPEKMVEIRIEVLRLFLAVLSRPLYQSMGEYRNNIPIFNSLIISGDFIHTANLFVSLLITVLEYETSRISIPVLSNTLGSDQDTSSEQELVAYSLNLINVLLDPPTCGEDVNVFREILTSGVSEKEEVATLVRLMRSKIFSLYEVNTSLSVSMRYRLRNQDGLILFLFNLLSLNSHVVDEVRHQYGSELVFSILSLLTQKVSEPSAVGLVHTCSFILLRVSSDREFVIDVLSRDYRGEIGSHTANMKLAAVAKISDLVIVILIRLVVSQGKHLSESLVEMWLTTCANMSSFVPGLSASTSGSVLNLLQRMSRPTFLLARPNRYHSVGFLIELINNCLQYQYDSNYNLVYSLLLVGPKVMENLDSLSPEKCGGGDASALAEIRSKCNLEPMRRLIAYLGPRIEDECRRQEGDMDHTQVTNMIRRISVVGILPVPHPIVVRQYQQNEQTRLWFTSYLWGVVFTSLSTMPIFDWKKVKMVTLSRPKGSAPSEAASSPQQTPSVHPESEDSKNPMI